MHFANFIGCCGAIINYGWEEIPKANWGPAYEDRLRQTLDEKLFGITGMVALTLTEAQAVNHDQILKDYKFKELLRFNNHNYNPAHKLILYAVTREDVDTYRMDISLRIEAKAAKARKALEDREAKARLNSFFKY